MNTDNAANVYTNGYDSLKDANMEPTVRIIKRNGSSEVFTPVKIRKAIEKANAEEKRERCQLTESQIEEIVDTVSSIIFKTERPMSVEEIQDIVEREICSRSYEVFMLFHDYRHKQTEKRSLSDIDKKIEGVTEVAVDRTGNVTVRNEEASTENSNKNVTIISTQRDYMAGEWSRYYTNKYLLPEDIRKAHEEGIIHFHDSDYFANLMTNCCLINLEDMLNNGTCISGTKIDPPKSFITACTVTSQISAAVASSQYGGQTITLAHLAPFVDVSRQKMKKRFREELPQLSEDELNAFVEKEVRKEVEAGCQTIQYQEITLSSTNGQAPFITVFMYLDEVPEGQTRDDLALIIEIMLRQRIKGVKDKTGHYVSPAFPKLIYALDEDNIHEDSKYYHLTELAAKCTAKRLVPDYVSVKKMKELKGDVYPPMGCVDGKEVIDYKVNGTRYVESFERAWSRLQMIFGASLQPDGKNLIINPKDTYIWDNVKDEYVSMKHMIRNSSKDWLELTFSNGRVLDCTPDHPFETSNGIKHACDLTSEDIIAVDKEFPQSSNLHSMSIDAAWCLGLILCDGTYSSHFTVSLGNDENDIASKYIQSMKNAFDVNVKIKHQERGAKGVYNDLTAVSNGNRTVKDLCCDLQGLFGGDSKLKRHIPSIIFDSSEEIRLAFLAGMIDADGYINDKSRLCLVQIGSTNKELSIQQMLLAQSLGMRANIYRNHYGRNNNVRYRVEFTPSKDLLRYIVSDKKRNHMTFNERKNNSIAMTDSCYITSSKALSKDNAYSYDVTTESEHFTVSGIYSHNCRSFLTPDTFTDAGLGNVANAGNYDAHKHKYYGRFNQGVVTINLVDVACSSKKDMKRFFKILDERLELCHRALRLRHERLLGTPSDVAPILWQDGAYARLKPGETIDKLLYNGYSTISLGYAGIAEMTYYMLGVSHTTEEGKAFALEVMQRLNDACARWKEAENIAYSVYGTPLESTTYKFAKCLKRRFGVIEHVTDKDYITNSFHVHVTEPIDAFTKLSLEAEFQHLSPGGVVNYVEVPNLQDNLLAVLEVMKHIYETNVYAELNTKSDFCEKCGYDGEIQIVKDEETGKLVWECPNCGNRNQSTMHVTRRTCGYIGTQYWNQGRTAEIADRVLHL